MDEDEFYWRKDEIFLLIDLVRQCPQLWNSKNKYFTNEFRRELAFSEISKEIGVTNEEVKKKFQALQRQYTLEVQKKESKHKKKSNWPYFDAMVTICEPLLVRRSKRERAEKRKIIQDDYESEVENRAPAKQQCLDNDTVKEAPYKWNQKNTLKLLETYREYPELYSSNYMNKYQKNIALESVAKKMGTTVEVIKKKMHVLRTMYTQEVKRMKNTKSSKPRFKLFDAIKFLYDDAYYKPPPRYDWSSSVEKTIEPSVVYNLKDEDSGAKNLKNDSSTASAKMEIEVPQQTTVICRVCKERDECTEFGETVAAELRLSKDHDIIHQMLKAKILQAIEDAKELLAEVSS